MSLQGPSPSSPNFKISEIACDFLKEKVNAFKTDLSWRNPEQSEKIQNIFNRTLFNLDRVLDTVKTDKAFAELRKQEIESIQIALNKIKLSSDVDLPQLKHLFDICEKIAEKDPEIQDELLTPYIDEPWLYEFLDWALEKRSIRLDSFLLENQNHPLIQRVIEKGVERKSNVAIDVLIFFSNDSGCFWARNLLIEGLEKNENPILLDTLRDFLQMAPNKCIWLQETLFKWLENDQPNACELLLDFFLDDQNHKVQKMIMDFIIKKCGEGNHKWQMMATVLGSMNQIIFDNLAEIGETIDSEKIKELDHHSQIWCQNFNFWIKNLSEKLSSYFKRTDTISDSRCFQVCLRNLETLFQIHLFIIGSSDYERLGRNGTSFFPKAKGILFGDYNLIYQSIVNDVGKFLLDKNIDEVTCYQCIKEDLKTSINVKVLPSTSNAIWLRDDFHPGYQGGGEMSYKISNFVFDHVHVFDYYKKQQDLRYNNKKYHYGSMGRSLEEFTMFQIGNLYYELLKKEDRKLETLWTYGEGGNFRFGIDEKGGRYCLLGKDTFELNRAILSQEIKNGNYTETGEGYKFEGFQLDVDETRECTVSDELLLKFFKRDYGEDIEFIPIEQPHAFHIDMKLAIVGPKKVILNDSVRALQVALEYFENELYMAEEKWAQYVGELRAQAAHEKELEDKCAADLVQAGFEVERVPGVFQNIYRGAPELEQVNFFNHITLETSGDPPRHILFALGCAPKFQELFKTIMKEHCVHSDVEILFVNKAASQKALNNGGGLNCLTSVLEEEI